MIRKRNFVKCLLVGVFFIWFVSVSGCGDLLGVADSVQNSIPQLATGTQKWDAYDAFDFRTQKLYKRDSDSPITSGDIYLVSATSTTQIKDNWGSLVAEWFPHSIVKLNARAVYNAGEDTTIDCRTASYNSRFSAVEMAQGEGTKKCPIDNPINCGIREGTKENYLVPTTICINTQEGNIAKIVFHNKSVFSFDWTYYSTLYENFEEALPNNYEARILEKFKDTEWIKVSIHLKSEHSINLASDAPDEKIVTVAKLIEKINEVTIASVLETLSDEEIRQSYKLLPSNKFSGLISKKGFEKLIRNPKVKMIYYAGDPWYLPDRVDLLYLQIIQIFGVSSNNVKGKL